MNGTVITETPIAVDFWQWKKCPQSKVFFLSHAHSDHTSGLSSTWRHPIYCSEVTGKVAVAKCAVKDSLIRPLAVGESHIIPLDDSGKETMTVTLFDANHCPGATMFLFEGYFGRILYTGDFRFQPSMLTHTVLKERPAIDRLYLDNTYNMPSCEFPSEIDCKVEIMEILAKHPIFDVVLGMHQLGKEDLLVDVANFFEEDIQVTPERLSCIKLLGCDDVFTNEKSRIRVVPVHTITWSSVERWNSEIPTIAIIPSAIFQAHRKSQVERHPRVFVVPYSSHSSYSELVHFVKQLRPRKIIPIVHPPPSKAMERGITDMYHFAPYLDPTASTTFIIPPCVEKYMKSSSVNICTTVQSRKRQIQSKKRYTASKSASGVVFEDDTDSDKDNNNVERDISEETNEYKALASLGDRLSSPSERTVEVCRTIECDVISSRNCKCDFSGIDIIATHLRKEKYHQDCYRAMQKFYAVAEEAGIS